MNSKNKDFDKYVKGLLSEESSVPPGMEWENMDIEIPRKKSRRPIIFLLVFSAFGLLSFLSGYYFYTFKSDDLNTGSTLTYQETDSNKPNDKERELIVKANESDQSIQTIEKDRNSSKTTNDKENKVDRRQNIQRAQSKVFNNSASTLKTNLTVSDLGSLEKTKHNDFVKNNSSLFFKDEAIKIIQESDLIVREIKAFRSLIMQNKLLTLDRRSMPSMKLEPILIQPQNLELRKRNLYFLMGSNYSKIQFAQLLPDETSVTSKLGLALAVGYQKEISNNTYFFLGLNYQRVHSVFENARKIGEELDIQTLTNVISIEHTYHNNFSQYLGIDLGLGLNIINTDKFIFQTGLSFSSQYLMALSGKSILDEEIVFLEDLNTETPFSFLVKPTLGIQYKLFDKYNLGLSYNCGLNVFNDYYITNHAFSKKNQQLLLGLNIEF